MKVLELDVQVDWVKKLKEFQFSRFNLCLEGKVGAFEFLKIGGPIGVWIFFSLAY